MLLVLSVASLGLIIVKGSGGRGDRRSAANAADLVFRRDAAAQQRDAAALLPRLGTTAGLRRARVLLATESGGRPVAGADHDRPPADVTGAVRRHFQGDILLARIEVASGAGVSELADARRLLKHGRRGIADLSAA